MCEYIWFFFFFNDTPTTEIYTYCHTLSLHDALPISSCGFRLLLVRASGNGFQPVFPPGLEHRDRPELGAPVPRSGEMLFPQPADGRGVAQAVGFHSGRIQEMLRPVPQRAAQPFGDGNGEEIGRAHVGTPVTNAQLICRLLL